MHAVEDHAGATSPSHPVPVPTPSHSSSSVHWRAPRRAQVAAASPHAAPGVPAPSAGHAGAAEHHVSRVAEHTPLYASAAQPSVAHEAFDFVGAAVGATVGDAVGEREGARVDGSRVGASVGPVGNAVEGVYVGNFVGDLLGNAVVTGKAVGTFVGKSVGYPVDG